MTLAEILGYVAAILLIVSFYTRTILWLRAFAIAGSVVLAGYAGAIAHWPLLAIAIILIAINIYRLVEMQRLVGVVAQATAGAEAPVSVEWILPYMRPLDVPKDTVLFRKGDIADAMYFISEGKVRIEELGIEIPKGNLFGEIGIFSIDRMRTATAVAAESSSLLSVPAERVRELYYQNPDFGFYLVGVITRRLTEDVERAAGRR
jgi:hypothetical protein